MQKYQFVKVDSILAKFKRDFKGLDIEEGDAIEWIGEALEFMKVTSASKHSIHFAIVKNYHTDIPKGLHYITQIARNNEWENPDNTIVSLVSTMQTLSEECDEECSIPSDDDISETCQDYIDTGLQPHYNLQYEYLGWATSNTRRNKYTPVTLSNHSFFDSLVCKEEGMEDLYCPDCLTGDEYTIAGDQLRFNFEDGFIAIAHTGSMLDPETGYPMIPDNESARAAITYYLTWKYKENEAFNHREGALNLAKEAESRWLKYVKQFTSNAKMPSGTDQYQNLANQSNYLIPPRKRYYGFFGNLNKPEYRKFNHPNNR